MQYGHDVVTVRIEAYVGTMGTWGRPAAQYSGSQNSCSKGLEYEQVLQGRERKKGARGHARQRRSRAKTQRDTIDDRSKCEEEKFRGETDRGRGKGSQTRRLALIPREKGKHLGEAFPRE